MNSWEKDELLKKITKGKVKGKNLSDDAKNDFVIMAQICQNNVADFEFVSEGLKSNREFIKYIIENCINSSLGNSDKTELFELFPDWIKSDIELCLSAIKKRARVLNFVDNKLKTDLDFGLEAIKSNPQVIHYCSDELRNDIEVSKMVVNRGYCTYRSINEIHKLNTDIFFKSIEISGYDDFEYTPVELFSKRENIFKIIELNSSFDFSQVSLLFSILTDEFKNDHEIINLIAEKNGFIVKFISEEFKKNNKELVIKCLNQNGNLLEFANDEVKNNENLVKKCLLSSFESFQFASESLRNNSKFVIDLIESDLFPHGGKYHFKLLGNKLLNNKEFVLKVLKVQKDSEVFQFLNEELRSDQDIVIEAIKEGNWNNSYGHNNNSFKLVGEKLLNKKEFAMEVFKIQKNSSIFQFLNEELRSDQDIVIEAILNLGKETDGNYRYELHKFIKENDNNILKSLKQQSKHCTSDNMLWYLKESKYKTELLTTKDLVRAFILTNFHSFDQFNSIPSEFQNDKELAMWVIEFGLNERNCSVNKYIDFLNEELKNDPDIIKFRTL